MEIKMIKKFICLCLCFWSVSILANTNQTTDKNTSIVQVLEWEDLIPEFEKKLLEVRQRQSSITGFETSVLPDGLGKVRQSLDGEQIKIAGFIIPLEGDEEKIYEMLLVPYVGACFHVPPPPANQIIYVTFKQGVAVKNLWDVLYVEGTLRTQTVDHELAEVGYVLEGVNVEEYEES